MLMMSGGDVWSMKDQQQQQQDQLLVQQQQQQQSTQNQIMFQQHHNQQNINNNTNGQVIYQHPQSQNSSRGGNKSEMDFEVMSHLIELERKSKMFGLNPPFNTLSVLSDLASGKNVSSLLPPNPNGIHINQQQQQHHHHHHQQHQHQQHNSTHHHMTAHHQHHQQHDDSILAKRKFALMSTIPPAQPLERLDPAPVSSKRVKGQLYLVKGKRKKWDGKRFARCCSIPSCDKLAQGTTDYCKSHGGGTRCSTPGCDRAARGGSTNCAAHGGGKRCTFEGCSKAAIGQLFCRKHGGGKQCSFPGCKTSARGKTPFCVLHGGGVRCIVEGCKKSARANVQGKNYCRKHSKVSHNNSIDNNNNNSPLVSPPVSPTSAAIPSPAYPYSEQPTISIKELEQVQKQETL